MDCSCVGGSSGPCKSIAGNNVCYDKNVLGDCPAGTSECVVATVASLDLSGEAVLLNVELSGVPAGTSGSDLADSLSSAIAATTGVDVDDVEVVSAAPVVESDSGAVAALSDGATSVVVGVVVHGQSSGAAVNSAVAVSESVESGQLASMILGGAVQVVGVAGSVSPSAAGAVGSAGAAGQANTGGTSVAATSAGVNVAFVAAGVAGVLVVAVAAFVVIRRRRASANRVVSMHRVNPVRPNPLSHVADEGQKRTSPRVAFA